MFCTGRQTGVVVKRKRGEIQMKSTLLTHIEVTQAKDGKRFGIEDGHLLRVNKETKCFFFVTSHSGQSLKISKQTKRLCYWSQTNTSPVFNV
jgi:hypothetical protein